MLACMKNVQVNNAKPYFRPFVFEISTHELCRYLFAGVFLVFFAAFGLFFHLFQGYTVCPWCDLCRMPTPTESSNCPEFHPFVVCLIAEFGNVTVAF